MVPVPDWSGSKDALGSAPDITGAILAGTQSARITVESLREPIPLDWSEQRRLCGQTDR
jgi:hypothetical protein